MAHNEIKEDQGEPSSSGPADIQLPFRSLSRFNASPIINIEVSLSPSTHCFTRSSAPIVYLRLTLLPNPSSPSPLEAITLYTENSPLDLQRTLSRAGFTITDLTTQQPLKVTNVRNAQRMPYPSRRVRGSFEEPYFLTIHSGETVELPLEFVRRNFRPQPWSIVKIGHELDEAGNPRNIRRSASVTGVDGLEPGHEYEISLNAEDLGGIMWAPVAKEDILFEKGYKGPGAGLMDYPWIRDQPLEFHVGTAKLKVLEKEEDT
ncbi:hypothetical protein F5Y00DRAFT_183755 [Daldinia vernicosa]|uniref:uncharacterized protein n=1 Tax=Daldinia vernicosa TaxID=114800 RepID=UPI0020075D68|nr:uncharacterized protein F5Y00DRAFT_183755 [Daldinia vernicosa]KAI0845031.1 hypothetical protein F5Y00DRAFT_183755 [Daldinia vernicosa]